MPATTSERLSVAASRWIFALFGLILTAIVVAGESAPPVVITLSPVAGDNAPAIARALASLRSGGRLVLEPGRYDCRSSGGPVMIGVSDLVGVEFDGSGAVLVGRDPLPLLGFGNCRGLVLRRLRFDWDPLPFTSGRVVATDLVANSLDLVVDSADGAVPGRIVQALFAYDRARNRLAENGWDVYQTQGERDADPTQALGGGLLRMFVARGQPLPQVGWEVIARHQVYGHNAISLYGCREIRIDEVEINSAPGMALWAHGCRDLTLRHLRVRPRPGSLHSTTADALHFSACRGTITIEDGEFSGMGDDALNIHGMYGLVEERLDARTVAVVRARLHPYYDKVRTGWDPPLAGDRIEAGGGSEPLLPKAVFTVAAANPEATRERTLLRAEADLPPDIVAGSVLANASAAPSVRIRRCLVRGNRARGMLLQTRDVVIEDCRFEDISAAAIQLCADGSTWWECLGVREVTVRGCTFLRCNFGAAKRAAAVDVFSELAGDRQSAAGVHAGIRILDCRFAANGGADLHLGSAEEVEVRGNRFVRDQGPVIRVVNSRRVTIAGNQLEGTGGGVRIEGSSEAASVSLRDNPGFPP